MRSLGVLDFVRKKKRAIPAGLFVLGFIFGAPFSGETAKEENVVMQTPSSFGAAIGKDPDTGTRVMQMPEPEEQETYQGPQTVIVAPEVYPDGPGHRPSKPRPR
jgi:hypothetical protein